MFLFKLGIGQDVKSVDSLEFYIRQLNWTSFEISNNYIPFLTLKDIGNRLVSLKDERKLQELLKNINDTNKTVAIHIILTKIIEPLKNEFSQYYEYAKDSSICTVRYSYNGLTWYYENKKDKNHIQKGNRSEIREYWNERIKKK